MFDIGWSELLLIAVVAILVVGPKDLPKMLHTVGKYVGQIRRMARDFQNQFDQAVRDSELQEMRDSVDELNRINPLSDVEKTIRDVKNDVEDFSVDKPSADSPSSTEASGSSDDSQSDTASVASDKKDDAQNGGPELAAASASSAKPEA